MKFKNRAAVIDTPDLLTPGISETTCIRPITKADLKLKFFSILFTSLNLSLEYRSNAKIIVVQAITLIFLNSSIKLVFKRKNPTKIIGIEDIKILKNNS